MIRYFNLSLSLTIKTDVSDHTITVVLLQENGSITFMSKKMTTTEQNYEIIENKMLTII